MKIYTLLALPLFLLHILEEYYLDFADTDPSVLWLSMIADASPIAIYWTIQAIVSVYVVCLLWAQTYGHKFERSSFVLGIILIFELQHIATWISQRSYAPGAITAVPLVVLGILFWRHMFILAPWQR